MATIEIILLNVFNIISAIEGGIIDIEDLICNLLWIFVIPYMIIEKCKKGYKNRKNRKV